MASNTKYWFFPPYAPNKILHYTREFCGLNQKEMATLLTSTQGWLSKMEQGVGEVKFNLDQLQTLKEGLDISIDNFVCGQIPFKKLLKSFQNTNFLPARYSNNANAPIRVAYPILMSFVDQLGEEKTIKVLKSLNLKEYHFVEPTLLVNANLLWDLFELAVREKVITEKSNVLDRMVSHALDQRVFGDSLKNVAIPKKEVSADFLEFLKVVYMQAGVDEAVECNPKSHLARIRLPKMKNTRSAPVDYTTPFASYLAKLYSNLNKNVEVKHQVFFKEILEYEFA